MEEKVSVIMPLFNSEQFVKESIDSVLNQTYTNWELIIVDDCSQDKGKEIVRNYSKNDQRIVLLENTSNMGAAESRNRAIEYATGRFIAFLDSDDSWLPNKLEVQIKYMLDNNYELTFTSYKKIDEHGKSVGKRIAMPIVTYSDMLKSNKIGCLSAIYDSGKLGKVYMPSIRKRQDMALWLKILKTNIKAYGINEILAVYRVRKQSVSSNKMKVISYQWDIYRKIEGLNVLKSAYYFTWYTWYGFYNKFIEKIKG